MKIKAIITGATGMVGKGTLLECLESPHVESVLVINRRPIGMSHEKLKEVVHKDFLDLSPIRDELEGYNACFFCLGISSSAVSAEDYYRITYELTVNFARMVLELNPGMTFCYVSGAGTDSNERSRMRWANVKGKTENELLAMPFKAAWMFRPGFIQPEKDIKSATPLYNAFYMVTKPLFPVFKSLFPKYMTTTTKVGQAMINVVLRGYDNKHLENADINALAEM